MLALSRKNMVLLIAVILVIAVVASMAIIQTDSALWHHILSDGPNMISHF
jgi:hypothetical protein